MTRGETAIDDLQALQARASVYRTQGGRADGFLSRHAVDLMTDDLLQMVKDAQATSAAVVAIEAPMRVALQQATDRYNDRSMHLNSITKLLVEARRKAIATLHASPTY